MALLTLPNIFKTSIYQKSNTLRAQCSNIRKSWTFTRQNWKNWTASLISRVFSTPASRSCFVPEMWLVWTQKCAKFMESARFASKILRLLTGRNLRSANSLQNSIVTQSAWSCWGKVDKFVTSITRQIILTEANKSKSGGRGTENSASLWENWRGDAVLWFRTLEAGWVGSKGWTRNFASWSWEESE